MPFVIDNIVTEKLIVNGNEVTGEFCPLKFNFKNGSVGEKVSFRKNNYDNPKNHKDVIIPGVLEIARKNNQGLYNIALETGWNGDGPLNTEWSTEYLNSDYVTWGPLSGIKNRTYDTWINAIETPEGDTVPPLYVGIPTILHEITTDRYWLIKFTDWTPNANGGGFAYDRWEIYPEIEFERPNYQEDTIDMISDGVHIKRASNAGGIYNAVIELEFQEGVSPKNTRWNSSYTDSRVGYSGFDDLSNLENRRYTDFAYALDKSIGNNIIGTELIMHDLTTDLYHKFVFDIWQNNGNGGGFRYVREVIPQSCGIKFADGSILTTANQSTTSIFPYVDGDGNTIISDSSNDTVSVGNGGTHLIDNFSGMLMVNDHFSGRVELWIAGGGTTQLINTTEGPSSSTLEQNGVGYEWTNVDNLNGPFTFTVIKTRNEA